MKASPAHSKVAATIAALLLLSSGPIYGLQTEQPETKRILVLYSYNEGLPWEELINKSFQNALAFQSDFSIEINVEHTDRIRYADDEYRHKLIDLYRHKYSHPKMDLIIGVDDEAVSILLDFGEKLFPEIPIVLISAERKNFQRKVLKPHMTSLIWGVDIRANVKLIGEILPQTRHIFVVAGTSPSDHEALKLAQASLRKYTKRFAIDYLTDISIKDLIKKATQLQKQSAILYLVFSRDAEGKTFVPRKLLSILSKQANVPVFGVLDTYLGYGIVGGNLLSAEVQGKRCAEIALRIFRGESPKDMIPERTLNQLMFDWRQLKRWGISEDKLPPGSEIRYRGPSIWKEHGETIIGAIALITSQTALIFGLFVNLRRRRLAEKSLTESEARLSLAAESADAGMWGVEAANGRVWATNKTRELFGLPMHISLHYEDFLRRVHPEDRERLNGAIQKGLQSGKDAVEEYRIQHADGSLRWLASHGRPQPAGPGHPIRMMGVTVDITERKLAEELMRQNQQDLSQLAGRIISAQEEELRRLSREIHDDLTQRLSALALDAALIEKQLTPSQSRIVEELRGLRSNLSEVAEEVHDLSRRLHPSILDDLGLVQAVQAESAAFKSKTGIDLSFTTDGFPDSVPRQPALCLYRVIQEGLQNIAKHSGAKASSITLQGLSNGIRLLIEDNGVGFDPEEVRKKAGIGLSSMRERVRLLNGAIYFASKSGQGTQIEVFIPTKEAP
jgi:PAS domain S-box-containing protein